MAATNASMTVLGLRSGITATVDCYVPDAAGGVWGFNKQGTAGSTSQTFVTFAEDITILDVSMVATPTSVAGVFNMDGVATSTAFRYNNYVYSVTTRPPLKLVVRAGQRLGVTNQ